MKKILICLCLVVSTFCYGQDIEWKLIRDSKAYDGYYKYVTEFKADQIVDARSTNIFSGKTGEMDYDYEANIYKDGVSLSIDAEAIIPNGTQDVLDESILTPAVNRQGKSYLNAISIDILKSKERETAKRYVPNGINYEESDGTTWWAMNVYDTHLQLFQTVIIPSTLKGYSSFYITNITKENNSYRLDVINEQWRMRDTVIPADKVPAIGSMDSGYQTNLVLYLDGDYLDIFYEGMYLLGSYITVDQEFVRQYMSLIETNTCDLTNVTFPRRADKNHTVGTSCIVAENLRLRKEESTSSATLQTMQTGTTVKILQLGKKQTIDGITANWVQVELSDGTHGWCFGGYLVEK